MAEVEATFNAFDDVKIDFGNIASTYCLATNVAIYINPIPRHKIADSDWVKLEKVLDDGTKVVFSVRPNYDRQSNRWKVGVTMSSEAEGPGTFRLIYTTAQGRVLATSQSFIVTESAAGVEMPQEDEATSQESLMSSFVTVSDQDEESFTAVKPATTDPSELSRITDWEDLGVLQVGSAEGETGNHQSPFLSHQTSSHQFPLPSHQTSAATVTELTPPINSLDQFQSPNKVRIKESSGFTYGLTAVDEENKASSASSSDEEIEQRELQQASVSHDSQQSFSHAVSSVHNTSSSPPPPDPAAMTASGCGLDVPSLSQSLVLVDYISQAEAKAALRNNKEMGLKITKLTRKIVSERQLHQQLRDRLQSCEEENSHLKERLACMQEEADELRMRLSSRDSKIMDKEDIVKKLETEKQRCQQQARDLHTKVDSYKVEVRRLNQATKTYQTQLKLLQTENTVLRQRTATSSNVPRVSSSPPLTHSPPMQNMVTGMTAVPSLRATSHSSSHRQRERHQAEPHSPWVQPGAHSGLGTEQKYQAGFGFKISDMVSSQHEQDKEREFRRTLMGDKDALIECPVCNMTMPARENHQAIALHVEACLKNRGYE